MALLHTITAFASRRAVLGDMSLATNVTLSRLPHIPHLDSIPSDIKGAMYVFFSAPSVQDGSQRRGSPMSYSVDSGYPALPHTHQAQPVKEYYLLHKGNDKH